MSDENPAPQDFALTIQYAGQAPHGRFDSIEEAYAHVCADGSVDIVIPMPTESAQSSRVVVGAIIDEESRLPVLHFKITETRKAFPSFTRDVHFEWFEGEFFSQAVERELSQKDLFVTDDGNILEGADLVSMFREARAGVPV